VTTGDDLALASAILIAAQTALALGPHIKKNA
jgi:hypothetical protein